MTHSRPTRRRAPLVVVLALLVGLVPATGALAWVGDEGCTPGYWKNHHEDWVGYAPSDTLGDVFGFTMEPFASDTLDDALRYRGGPDSEAKMRILLRAAAAALLNTTALDGYGLSQSAVLDLVGNDLRPRYEAGLDVRGPAIKYAELLDEANNSSCPL